MDKKLSDVSYLKALFYNKDLIEKIVYLNCDNDNKHTDIGLVFGEISQNYRLDRALELYKGGFIDKILLSGGIGKLSTEKHYTDVDYMISYLNSIGTSKDIFRDIIVENQSRDTNENIINSLKIVGKSANSYTLISSDFHLRRCTGLFTYNLDKFDLPAVFNLCTATDGFTDINSWRNCKKSQLIIYKELLSLICHINSGKMYDEDLLDISPKVKSRILK